MEKEYLDYLAHHGIKGQKWGERRFQNEDGTLTPEGRKRYGVVYGSQMDNIAKQLKRTDIDDDRREALKKEYSELQRLGEGRNHGLRKVRSGIAKASIALGIAHIATKGKSTKLLAKAGLKTMKAVYQSAQKIKNSRMVTDFIKRKNWRKNGVHVLKKSQFRVTPVGLPIGRG